MNWSEKPSRGERGRSSFSASQLRLEIADAVTSVFPEFLLSDERGKKRSLVFRVPEDSGIFEACYVTLPREKGAHACAVTFIVHLLKEAPVPAGVFGWELGLESIMRESASSEVKDMLDRSSAGLEWLAPGSIKMTWRSFLKHLQSEIRKNLDGAVEHLKSDSILRYAVEVYRKIEDHLLPNDFEKTCALLEAHGHRSQLGFPMSKIARQITLKIQGESTWNMV